MQQPEVAHSGVSSSRRQEPVVVVKMRRRRPSMYVLRMMQAAEGFHAQSSQPVVRFIVRRRKRCTALYDDNMYAKDV